MDSDVNYVLVGGVCALLLFLTIWLFFFFFLLAFRLSVEGWFYLEAPSYFQGCPADKMMDNGSDASVGTANVRERQL